MTSSVAPVIAICLLGVTSCVQQPSPPSFVEPPKATYSGDTLDVSTGGTSEPLHGARVSPDFFVAAGIHPLMGRFILEPDVRPGATVVVVLSHDYWRRQFGGTGEVIGKVITINGRPATIIGVAQGGFDIPDHAQLWIGRAGS